MNVLTYNPDGLTKSTVIPLGKACECRATRIDFTVGGWLARFPGGEIVLYVKDPNGEAYLATITTEDGVASWVLNNTDTQVSGYGSLELALIGANGEQKLSAVATTKIEPSLVEDELNERPEYMQPWIERAAVIQANTESAAKEAATYAAIASEGASNAVEAMDAADVARERAEVAADAAEDAAQAAQEAVKEAEAAEDAAAAHAADAATSAQGAAAAEKAAADHAQEAAGGALEADVMAQAAAEHAQSAEDSAQAAAAHAAEAKAAAEKAETGIGPMAPAIVTEASGAVVSLTDAAARNVQGLVTTISPSTAGVAEVTLTHTGRNLFPYTKDDIHAIAYTRVNGNESTVKGYDIALPAGTYQLRGNYKDPDAGYEYYVYGIIVDADGNASGKGNFNPIVGKAQKRLDFTIDEGERLLLYNGSLADNLNTSKTKLGRVNLGIYMPGSDTTYTPYEGRTITASLPVPVYGGTLDWLTGELTATHDASGAELAEPTVQQLDAQVLTLHKGCNALWSDCGDTSAIYIADTKLYIDDRLAAIAAAAINA